MTAAPGQRGYALLAAVLITALAAVFAAAAVAAAGAGLDVAASDAGAAVVADAAGEAFEQACAGLRRRPDRLSWAAEGSAVSGVARWSLACGAVPQAETTAAVQADVVALAWTPTARRRLHAVVELAPAVWAQGLTVGGDVRLHAPLTVSGGGLYCGGSVSGREFVTFGGPPADGQPAAAPLVPGDHVRGEHWSVAAVHALGGIWAQGLEIHEDPAASGADTDVHTGSGPIAAVAQAPSPAERTLLLEAADVVLTPGPGGSVDLSGIPAAPQSGVAALVVVVADPGTAVAVLGERADAACPLVLVVEGDAVLGSGGAPARLRGALIGFGSLAVEGPCAVEGHLRAASLTVDAPLAVTTPVDWRRRPLPTLTAPVVLAAGR
jgi:hypothetical protein